MQMGVLMFDPRHPARRRWVVVETATADGDEAVRMARSFEPGWYSGNVMPAADVPELRAQLRASVPAQFEYTGEDKRIAEPDLANPALVMAAVDTAEPATPLKRPRGRPRKHPAPAAA